MIIIYPPHYPLHCPPYEIFNGEKTPHSEIPSRIERILSALKKSNYSVNPVGQKLPREFLLRIHTTSYLKFLENACLLTQSAEYIYPSVFSYRGSSESDSFLAKFGYFSFDLYTPLSSKTFEVAFESAACAYEAAKLVVEQGQRVVYALCRPPGHHAGRDQMGGYCYINNCAVAAEFLSQFGKVTTLDIDFHHGNGTQNIFYERNDVFTFSIHADPNWKFPFFTGFAREIGSGIGRGFNLNFPLKKGTTDRQYNLVLKRVLKLIQDFKPKYLVVSLGEDTHIGDPIGGFKLTTGNFYQMAKQISKLNLPTVIIQEGGYNTEKLGENVISFLKGFEL